MARKPGRPKSRINTAKKTNTNINEYITKDGEKVKLTSRNLFQFKHKEVARLMLEGHTNEEISNITGVALRTLSKWKNKPEMSAYIHTIQHRHEQTLLEKLHTLADNALDVVEEIMNDSGNSEHARLNAAKLILSYTVEPQLKEHIENKRATLKDTENVIQDKNNLREILSSNDKAKDVISQVLTARNKRNLNLPILEAKDVTVTEDVTTNNNDSGTITNTTSDTNKENE